MPQAVIGLRAVSGRAFSPRSPATLLRSCTGWWSATRLAAAFAERGQHRRAGVARIESQARGISSVALASASLLAAVADTPWPPTRACAAPGHSGKLIDPPETDCRACDKVMGHCCRNAVQTRRRYSVCESVDLYLHILPVTQRGNAQFNARAVLLVDRNDAYAVHVEAE